MRKTNSKLDLNRLQTEFDNLLKESNIENLVKSVINESNNDLEADIINKIGRNKENEKTFNDGVYVTGEEDEMIELLGFYTYRGEVAILDSLGMDNGFNTYSLEDQKTIHDAIMNDNWYY